MTAADNSNRGILSHVWAQRKPCQKQINSEWYPGQPNVSRSPIRIQHLTHPRKYATELTLANQKP